MIKCLGSAYFGECKILGCIETTSAHLASHPCFIFFKKYSNDTNYQDIWNIGQAWHPNCVRKKKLSVPTISRVFDVTSQQQSPVYVLLNLSPIGTSKSKTFGSMTDFRTSMQAFVWIIWALYPLIWSSVSFSNFRQSPFDVVTKKTVSASAETSHQVSLFIFFFLWRPA